MDGTIGEIRQFAASFAPRSWAYCNGQILAIQTNTALFSILGTTYGGNGSTTFGLPDFGGRTAIGTGQGPGLSNYVLGEKSGTNGITLTSLELPAHSHVSSATIAVPAYSDIGNVDTPTGNVLASKTAMYSTLDGDDNLKPVVLTVNVNPVGSSQPISITQPSIGINYIICLTGEFPQRS